MGRKVDEGDDDVWIVPLREASHLVTRLLWVCSGPRVSPNPECVWFFSCTPKSGFSYYFFLVFGFSPLQLPMCLALMALGWAGWVWYLWFMCPGFDGASRAWFQSHGRKTGGTGWAGSAVG